MSDQLLANILTALVALYGAYSTYRNARQRNVIDENRNKIDELAETQRKSEEAAQARIQQRSTEKEQERKDRESLAASRLAERKSDLEVLDLYRQQVTGLDKDVRELRSENRTQASQIFDLTHKNDLLQRDFDLSEQDRKEKTQALTLAQTQLIRVTEDLRVANAVIAQLRSEMEHQHNLHEVRIAGLNELNVQTKSDFQRQIDQIKTDHHAQLEQIQINEGPRQLEITRLRYTLRQVNKALTQGQLEAVTRELEERGINYEALLFPKPDPILLMPLPAGNDDDPPPPGGIVDDATGRTEKIA